MEINQLLKGVMNLNAYTAATQDVLNRRKVIKVTLNIATVLTLKKIRSLEIEVNFQLLDSNYLLQIQTKLTAENYCVCNRHLCPR